MSTAVNKAGDSGGLEDVRRNKEQTSRTRKTAFSGFGLYVLALAICFAIPLFHWAIVNAKSELNSYVLLVPLVSAWLVWSDRTDLPSSFSPAVGIAAVFLLAAIADLAAYAYFSRAEGYIEGADRNKLIILGLVFLIYAGGFWFFGKTMMKKMAFPAFFLIFMVPLPVAWANAIEIFLQYASASAAGFMFHFVDFPVFRQGLVFTMPDISIRVAKECSGIHSSLVLLLTSMIAAYRFLRLNRWRAVLIAAVIPLGILRNGFRVVVISFLCVHIGPWMINSWIHHQGGPVFFALSLIPLFLLAVLLRKIETKQKAENRKQKAEMEN